MVGPHSETRPRWLKWLAIFGAMLLLAGVLIFCHAELRGAQYIDTMNSIINEIDKSEFDPQRRAELDRLSDYLFHDCWDSFSNERWWGHQVIAPLGAGMLAGSLLAIVAVVPWRFSVRTLFLVTVYFILLIGIPFGAVRPRLHNPQIWLQAGPSIDRTFVKYRQGSTRLGRRGGGPSWSFRLVDWKNLLVAVGASVSLTRMALTCRSGD